MPKSEAVENSEDESKRQEVEEKQDPQISIADLVKKMKKENLKYIRVKKLF